MEDILLILQKKHLRIFKWYKTCKDRRTMADRRCETRP